MAQFASKMVNVMKQKQLEKVVIAGTVVYAVITIFKVCILLLR